MPNSSRGLIFFLAFLAASLLSAQERIEWEPVAGADHYLVEIRQNGELVLETRSEEPFIPLFLPPGHYDLQIGVGDVFGNVRFTGEPSHLKITAPLIPFIINVSPRIIQRGTKPLLTARVSGLLEGEEQSTVFLLENAKGRSLQLSWEAGDPAAEGQIEITLSGRKRLSDTGAWHLIMANPDGREDRFEGALTVGTLLRISSMSPRRLVAGNPNAVLRLRARGFSGEATLLIEGPSAIPIAKLNQGEENFFEFSLNLSDALEGQYLVSLVNPSGASDTGVHSPKTASSGEALRIEKKPLPNSEPPNLLKASKGPSNEKESQPNSEFPNAIYGGWKPLIRSIDIDTAFYYHFQPGMQPSYMGFSLGYSRSIEDVSRGTAYLDGLEWYLSANYAQDKNTITTPNSEKVGEVVYRSLAFLFGLAYTTRFDFPLNPLAMLGLGVDFSFYRFFFKPFPSVPRFLLRSENSARFFMSFDLGLRWDITPRFFVNATANAMMKSAINGNNEWSLQPRVEGGWRW